MRYDNMTHNVHVHTSVSDTSEAFPTDPVAVLLAFFLFLAFAAAFDLADVLLAELKTVSFMSYLPDLDFMLILARLP